MSVTIDEFEVSHGNDGNITLWRAGRDRVEQEATFDGEYAAKVLVSLGVDGMFEVVSADLQQTGMTVALSHAIDALTRLYDAVRDGDVAMGRCVRYGDFGRCKARQGDPCDFPTEAEMNAEFERQAVRRALRAKGKTN